MAPEAAGATVYVMASESAELDPRLAGRRLRDTGVRGQWRDDTLRLVPYRLYAVDVHGGDRVSVPGATADYVVLVKGGV